MTVALLEEGLEAACRLCGTKEPDITLIPQEANTLPILRGKILTEGWFFSKSITKEEGE